MLIYATPTELRDFIHGEGSTETPPENAQLLIREASSLVSHETRSAVYDTDAYGLATDVKISEALRDATLTQAAAWAQNKIVPGTLASRDQRVASKSLGGAAVTYESDPAAAGAAAELASGEHLIGSARRLLLDAGLITTEINGGRRVGPAYVGSWPVDVNTGTLIGPGDAALPSS